MATCSSRGMKQRPRDGLFEVPAGAAGRVAQSPHGEPAVPRSARLPPEFEGGCLARVPSLRTKPTRASAQAASGHSGNPGNQQRPEPVSQALPKTRNIQQSYNVKHRQQIINNPKTVLNKYLKPFLGVLRLARRRGALHARLQYHIILN